MLSTLIKPKNNCIWFRSEGRASDLGDGINLRRTWVC